MKRGCCGCLPWVVLLLIAAVFAVLPVSCESPDLSPAIPHEHIDGKPCMLCRAREPFRREDARRMRGVAE